jgi:basic amino acid/polyamine antiporter, APA family
MTPAQAANTLPRRLGLLDATNVVVGTMIGSAIFLVPNTVAENVPSAPLILALWVFAGFVSLFGALAYAELGAMMPETGGQYVYLREAWGPLWGFLCGWTFFLAARSGATAAVAAGFAIYLAQFFPMPLAMSRVVAAALILVLTIVNYRGVRLGATVQNIFTSLKVIGLVVLIGSTLGSGEQNIFRQPVETQTLSAANLGGAMISCMWAYNGWFALSLVAGEIKDPKRNLPRALFVGTAFVMLVYLLANIGYLQTLAISEIAGSPRVAAAAADRTLGNIGSTFVGLTILVSTFGTTNGNMMTAPRLYFAQARDGLFFRAFGGIHPAFETPHISILGQGIWAAVLALTGSYAQLVSYATFTFWIFYGMTVAGLIVLRRKRPESLRPYRMFGYPATALVFIGVAGWVAFSAIISAPATSAFGMLILAAGVPAYYLWRRRARRQPNTPLSEREP